VRPNRHTLHWGLVQKIGIHLWDGGIALSYFAVDARETHSVFESKGNVQQNPPGPPPICSCLAAHRLDVLPLPWPPDPCEMIVDSGIAAYSIPALKDCHCTSDAGGGVSRSFLIHTTLRNVTAPRAPECLTTKITLKLMK
jgi:hypothetical protein